MALTKKQIDAAKYRGKVTQRGGTQDIRYDDKIPGFGVRIYPSGKKSFVLKFRTRQGRTRLATIGRYGALTLDQARTRARKMAVELTDGKDPLEEQRREAIPTLRAFAPEYLEHVRLHNKSWKEAARRLGFRYVEEDKKKKEPAHFEANKDHPGHILPKLGSRTLTEIRAKDVQRLHDKIGKHAKYEANRTVTLLSAVLSHGLPEGAANPAAVKTNSRKDGIKLFPEKPRKEHVKPEEMPKLLDAIEEEPNVYIRGVIWLALLTSCRKSELLGREWDEVDFEEQVLRLPDTKSGRPRDVPLSAPALKVLEDLPRQHGNPYIFPGSGEGTSLTKDALKKPWTAIRKRAGLERTTFHDLRRIFGSWSLREGVPIAFISKALGHSSIRITEKAYAHLSDSEPRQALEAHGERLLRVVEGGKK